jgi:hypothetical protein
VVARQLWARHRHVEGPRDVDRLGPGATDHGHVEVDESLELIAHATDREETAHRIEQLVDSHHPPSLVVALQHLQRVTAVGRVEIGRVSLEGSDYVLCKLFTRHFTNHASIPDFLTIRIKKQNCRWSIYT